MHVARNVPVTRCIAITFNASSFHLVQYAAGKDKQPDFCLFDTLDDEGKINSSWPVRGYVVDWIGAGKNNKLHSLYSLLKSTALIVVVSWPYERGSSKNLNIRTSKSRNGTFSHASADHIHWICSMGYIKNARCVSCTSRSRRKKITVSRGVRLPCP